MSNITLHYSDGKATARCQNCDWSGPFDDTLSIVDAEERLTPGEIVPAGECPECGSLAHLDPPPEWSPLAKLAQAEARAAKLTAALALAEFVVEMVAGDQHESGRDEDEPDAEAVLTMMAEAEAPSGFVIMTTAEHIAAAERFILEGIADRERMMATETDYSTDDMELTRADIARAHQFIADARRGQ